MHQLSKETVRLVSSAQVITSPASVVKECLENSLDAGATILEVRLENHGFTSIIIKDNGTGVSPENANLMAKAHYTSKITDHSDLEHLETYGFRGEALSSIAAVSRLTVETKTDTDPVGLQYDFNPMGEPMPHCPKSIAMTRGTIVKIHQLFDKLPVRKEMYSLEKKRKEELKKVEEVVIGIAVGHPEVAFSLAHNKQVIWRKPKVASLVAALGLALDVQAMKQLVKVERCGEDVKIECCLPKPDKSPDAVKAATRSNDSRLFIFVNKRNVKFAEIRKLVSKYYFNSIGEESNGSKTPVGAVLITLQPAGVDVNLEPNKTRVLLVDEKAVFTLLEKLLEELYGPLESPPAEQKEPQPVTIPVEPVVQEEVEVVTSTPHFQSEEIERQEPPTFSGISGDDFEEEMPSVDEKSVRVSVAEEKPREKPNQNQPLDNFTFSDLDDDDFFAEMPSPPAKKPRTEENSNSNQLKQPNVTELFTQQKTPDIPVALRLEDDDDVVDAEAWAEGKALKDPLTKENVEPVRLFCPAGPSLSNVRKKLDSASKLAPNTVVVGSKLLRKPPGARELFEKEARKEILKENPDINFCNLGTQLMEGWKKLDDTQRAKFHEKSQVLANDFKERLSIVKYQQQAQQNQPKLNFNAPRGPIKIAPISNMKRSYLSTRNLEADLPLDMSRMSIRDEYEEDVEEDLFGNEQDEVVEKEGLRLVGALLNGFWIVKNREDGVLAVVNHFRLAEAALLENLKKTGDLSLSMRKHEASPPVDVNSFTSDEWAILEKLAEKSEDPLHLDDEKIVKNGLDVSLITSAGPCPALYIRASIHESSIEALNDLKEIISKLDEDPNCSLEKCRPAGVIQHMKEAVETKMATHPEKLNNSEMKKLLESAGVADKISEDLFCPHRNVCMVILGESEGVSFG